MSSFWRVIFAIQDWARAVLVNLLLQEEKQVVCQLFYGIGLDTGKWHRAKVAHLLAVEPNLEKMAKGKKQFAIKKSDAERKHGGFLNGEFLTANIVEDKIASKMVATDLEFDHVACFEGLDEILDSETAIESVFQNVNGLLKEGGYFFGIMNDSGAIWTQAQKSLLKSLSKIPKIQTKNLTVSFAASTIHHIGSEYQWEAEKKSATYFLVHIPTLTKIATSNGFVPLSIQNLIEFYEDHRGNFSELLNRAIPRDQFNVEAEHKQVMGFYTTFVFQKKSSDK